MRMGGMDIRESFEIFCILVILIIPGKAVIQRSL